VNRSFFRCLATCRMRVSACDTLSRSCARRVLCWLAFPSASALGSTDSAAGCPALFVGFPATIAESDFPRPFIIGYGSSPPECGQSGEPQLARRGISRFPSKELLHMPGSSTTPGRSDLAMVHPKRVAFRTRNSVGARRLAFAAQWLAYALPYRRFVGVLTDANARLGADVDRYSFIVVDLHPLLLAGLPAHFESSLPSQTVGSLWGIPSLQKYMRHPEEAEAERAD